LPEITKVQEVMMSSTQDVNPIYNTVSQLSEDPAFCFSKASLRYYILHAHKNGLSKAIRRVGRKLLIRRDLFVAWIEEQAQRRVR